MIAPALFGDIQSRVGAFDNIFDIFIRWMALYFSNANAKSDGKLVTFKFDLHVCHAYADTLGKGQGLLRAGLGQQDDKFIPAIARQGVY